MRKLYALAALLTACAAPPAPTPATPPPATPPPAAPAPLDAATEQLWSWIDAYAGSYGKRWGEASAAHGYLAVARDGKLIFGRAYGFSDRDKHAIAGLDTRFRIGSLTKQFTAVAIAQLAQQGLLRVEDPIRKYLPDAPPAWDAITIQQLLTHTAGVPSYTQDEALMAARGKAHTHAEVLAHVRDKPLDFTPGERFRYSNTGYFLLGMIVEKVSGKSYEAFLRERVLGPAGMDRTSTVDAPGAPDTAVGYATEGDHLAPALSIDMSVPFAAGALRSTVRDLLAWDRALTGEALLEEHWKKRLYTPEKGDYAWGIRKMRILDHEVLTHNGGIDGFTSFLARVPDQHLVVIALSNLSSFDAEDIGVPALKMALGGKPLLPPAERAPAPFDEKALGRVVGAYALTEASRKAMEGKLPGPMLESVRTITISTEDGHVYLKPVGQQRSLVLPAEGGGLFTKQHGGIEIDFSGEVGAARTFVFHQAGLTLTYERVAPPPR